MHMSNLLRYTVIRLLFSIVGTITLYVIIFLYDNIAQNIKYKHKSI